MTTTLEKILSNNSNEKVIKFLGLDKNKRHTFTSFDEKDFFTHEGLEDFLKIDVPRSSKFIIDNYGVIIKPETGEIIAFQFGRFDIGFKIINPQHYYRNYEHIKDGLLENQKSQSANKVSLGYFSNIYDDGDTIIDISELGDKWALSIYFLGQTEKFIKEFYYQNEGTSTIYQVGKIIAVIVIITVLIAIAYYVMFSPLPVIS